MPLTITGSQRISIHPLQEHCPESSIRGFGIRLYSLVSSTGSDGLTRNQAERRGLGPDGECTKQSSYNSGILYYITSLHILLMCHVKATPLQILLHRVQSLLYSFEYHCRQWSVVTAVSLRYVKVTRMSDTRRNREQKDVSLPFRSLCGIPLAREAITR